MKKLILVAILIVWIGKLHAQKKPTTDQDTTTLPFLTVKEVSANKLKPLDLTKTPIVDINSKLSVALLKTQLISALPASKVNNPQLTAKLKTLLFILRSQNQMLQALKPPVKGKVASKADIANISTLMSDFYQKILINPEIRTATNSLFDSATVLARAHKLRPTYLTQESYVIKKLSLITDTIATHIQNSQGVATVAIQLEAFLNTNAEKLRKVHVENFDNYSAGEYYEVPRWVTAFSQSDVDAFNQVSATTNTLNSLLNSKFSDLIKTVPDSLNTYTCFTGLLKSIQTQSAAITSQTKGDVSAFIASAESDVKNLISAMQNVSNLKNAKDINALQQFNQTTSQFIAIASNFKNDITALQSQLTATSLAANQDLTATITQLNSCINALQDDIDSVSYLYNVASNLLSPLQAAANTAQQVTGNAYSLTIDKLPTLGYIDLKTTGRRENGDELVLKVIYRTKDDQDKNLPGTTLENETIQLQQVNFYSESNISVILAKPFHSNSQVTLGNKFQFAPGGSLLLKFGSRTSQLWNDISPGFGFNVSTPDFNLDGSPDVSYGGVVTLFKNVLSMGLAYNTKTSSPFWFFGLSLPFATLGLPLGNVQTQKN